jgi:hypothetical protein
LRARLVTWLVRTRLFHALVIGPIVFIVQAPNHVGFIWEGIAKEQNLKAEFRPVPPGSLKNVVVISPSPKVQTSSSIEHVLSGHKRNLGSTGVNDGLWPNNTWDVLFVPNVGEFIVAWDPLWPEILPISIRDEIFGWRLSAVFPHSHNRELSNLAVGVNWLLKIDTLQEDEGALGLNHGIASESGLPSTYPDQQAGKSREYDGKESYDSIRDLAFAYKFSAPFILFILALCCTIGSYEIEVFSDSEMVRWLGTLLGLFGPIGLLFGLW